MRLFVLIFNLKFTPDSQHPYNLYRQCTLLMDDIALRSQSLNNIDFNAIKIKCSFIRQKVSITFFLQIPADKHVLLAVRQTNSHKIHIKDQIVKYDRSQRVLKWVSTNTFLFYIILYNNAINTLSVNMKSWLRTI